MKSKYDYEIIRDYLHGLVDQQTARRIRELIRTDEVARNIASGILQLEHDFNGNEEEIEAYIDQLLHKQLKLINKPKTISIGVPMAAAILMIAVVGSVIWLMQDKNIVDQELNEPYALSADRGSDADAGFQLYNQKKYNEAIASFDPASTDATVIFYNGLSHLYAGYYEQAVTLLGSLEQSRYAQQAKWFQTLALIKAERMNEAKKNLESIVNDPNHYKSDVARNLLASYKD